MNGKFAKPAPPMMTGSVQDDLRAGVRFMKEFSLEAWQAHMLALKRIGALEERIAALEKGAGKEA